MPSALSTQAKRARHVLLFRPVEASLVKLSTTHSVTSVGRPTYQLIAIALDAVGNGGEGASVILSSNREVNKGRYGIVFCIIIIIRCGCPRFDVYATCW